MSDSLSTLNKLKGLLIVFYIFGALSTCVCCTLVINKFAQCIDLDDKPKEAEDSPAVEQTETKIALNEVVEATEKGGTQDK